MPEPTARPPSRLRLVRPADAGAPFDAVAGDYQALVERSVGFTKRPLEFFHERKIDVLRHAGTRYLRSFSRASVLDVGCGSGVTDGLLRPYVGSLHGVDVSEAMVEQARSRNPGCTYEIYDGRRLPFELGQFDLVATICVLHHVPPDRWSQFAAELVRVVRPGGVIVIIEHNRLNPLTRRAVNHCEFDRDAVLVPHRRAARLLREAGADPVETRHFLFSTFERGLGPALERHFRRLPAGGQYASIAIR
jgi:SAM-dependent methyltransferase